MSSHACVLLQIVSVFPTMAQSRLELIGTIYSRVTGLIKSKAIKAEQVPLWYNVYEAFPPKYEPRYDRVDEKPVRKILYQEDVVRAKYYKTYGNWEVVNLFSEEKTTAQLFFDKHAELAQVGGCSEAEIWDRAVSALEMEGIRLDGKATFDEDEVGDGANQKLQKVSFQDLFNIETK